MQKSCCIPVCKGSKFNLVHKFPSDRVKFLEWMTLLELANEGHAPNILRTLSQEEIKKRFFICCRHFSIDSYKSKLYICNADYSINP